MGRRLLVVTYYFPPTPHVGSNRWLAMTKYLRRAGHEVTVLTTSAYGALPDDAASDVHRSGDLVASGALRRVLRRPPLPEPGAPVPLDKPPSGLLDRVVVPDAYLLSWVPAATLAARRLVRERGIDCVITTSAPDSVHMVGMGARGGEAAWLADFRDGWVFDAPRRPFATRGQRALERWMEARVVKGADAVVAVSRPVGDDLGRRHGKQVAYIPSGWDPDVDREVETAAAPELEPGTVTIVHTGKLTGSWGRHPAPLFEALRRLIGTEPEVGRRLRLVLAGRLDTEEQRLVHDAGLDGVVRHVGHLPRPVAAALQRQADALLLLTSPTLAWEMPGKLLEYVAARRPILALASGNEAGRVVEETGTGITVSPDDVDEIAAALRRVARGELEGAYRPREPELRKFLHPAPAEAMAEQVENAIRHRRGS
jgi:glycosyltransferase involved in cell wall biosynthesis